MVRHSEDWWGVLRQGIESEHMGLVRQSLVLLGGLRLGLVWLGAEIELENMERQAAARSGPVRLGLIRSCQPRHRLGAVWKSNYNIWSWFGGLVLGIAGHGMAHLGAAGYRSGSVRKSKQSSKGDPNGNRLLSN